MAENTEENKNGIEFIELGPRGGKSRVEASDIEFTIENCNAYFGMDEGKPTVYALEEDMPGTYVPCLRLNLKLKNHLFNGTSSRIINELYRIHNAYRIKINEQKDSELNLRGI